MQKKLIALAVAGMFAAPAFAASSNVDVYGSLGMSVDYVDGGSGGASTLTGDASESRTRVSTSNSYIGFKGAEDLGGGLSALWQIEQVVVLDAGGGALATGRNSFAGLSNNSLGTLTFGNQDTPYKTSTGKLDVFTTHYIADYRSLFGAVSNGSVRAPNSVLYTSPSFGGLTLRAMGAAQQENGSSRDPRLYSLSGVYENGPLFLSLAYETNRYVTAAPGTVASAGGNTITTTGSAESDQKQWRAGVGFSFGDSKIGLGYEQNDLDVDALSGTLTGAGAAAGTSISTDRNAWYLGFAHKLGNTTLKAAYTKASEIDGVNNSGASQYSLGASYTLSKRTELFGLYTQVRNDSNASYSLGGGATGVPETTAAAAGQDPRGFSIGMIHKF